MFREVRHERAPSPGRITLGMVLMVLVAMWTFASPGFQAGETAAEVVIAEILHTPDAVVDTASERLDVRNQGPAPLDLTAACAACRDGQVPID